MPTPQRDQAMELRELMVEDGEEFVEAAYMALLKRRPDATGGRLYLRALRNGTSKLQILFELSESADCRRAGGEIPGLRDAFAHEGIGEAGEKPVIAPPSQALQVTRVEQLLLLENTHEFIEIAYWVLLKRAPDAEGVAIYHDRIQGGVGKVQILFEIFTSEECREIGVELPGLRDTFAREGMPVVEEVRPSSPAMLSRVATSLTELLAYQGGQFVECAYMTLLKRAPDTQGFQDRLQQLLAGSSKIQILDEMSSSQEANSAGVGFPELSSAIKRYRLSRTPVIGRLVKVFVDVEDDSVAERRGRAAEQRLVTLEAELKERVEHVERRSGDSAGIEQRLHVVRQELSAQIASLERSVIDLRQLIERVARQAPDSEPVLSDAMTSKSSSRLAHDLRTEEILRDLKNAKARSG